MKKCNEKHGKSWWKWVVMLLLLIWTGIVIGGLYRQYDLLGKLEKNCSNRVAKLGFNNVTLLQNTGRDMKNLLCGSTALLQYMMQRDAGEPVAQVALLQQGQNGVLDGQESGNLSSDEIEDIAVFNNGSFDITDKNISLTEYAQSMFSPAPTATNGAGSEKNVADNVTEKTDSSTEKKQSTGVEKNKTMIQKLKEQKKRSYLLKNFYIVDSSTSIDPKIFQVDRLLNMDMTMQKKKEPQILIYHTHGASEAFIDSKAGKKEESIIGVGGELAKLLTEKYGYHVLHDETEYDRINGDIDRNKAYNQSYAGVTKTLQKYPGIQVLIDLHRDGVGNKVHRLTNINGKRTAQVMFFNGLSRNKKGDIAYLHNDNLQANLAFSLQLKLACMEQYPDFAKPVYLKNYRYNLHLRERSLLIELGNENNTLQEAKNAMEPLAGILHQVLSKS
ncbi:MAG: stage II sporulation protein P [Lachnospiraceae bacterium]|nr:stage II sporulation protein P [Lachnospiraceae bacterium]